MRISLALEKMEKVKQQLDEVRTQSRKIQRAQRRQRSNLNPDDYALLLHDRAKKMAQKELLHHEFHRLRRHAENLALSK
jgi:hypothetical protein